MEYIGNSILLIQNMNNTLCSPLGIILKLVKMYQKVANKSHKVRRVYINYQAVARPNLRGRRAKSTSTTPPLPA